jgi:hypothetical protein
MEASIVTVLIDAAPFLYRFDFIALGTISLLYGV